MRENSTSDTELKSLDWKQIKQKEEIILYYKSLQMKLKDESIYPYFLRRFICFMALEIVKILKSNSMGEEDKRRIVCDLFKLDLSVWAILRVIPVHLKSYFALLVVALPYPLKKVIIRLK